MARGCRATWHEGATLLNAPLRSAKNEAKVGTARPHRENLSKPTPCVSQTAQDSREITKCIDNSCCSGGSLTTVFSALKDRRYSTGRHSLCTSSRTRQVGRGNGFLLTSPSETEVGLSRPYRKGVARMSETSGERHLPGNRSLGGRAMFCGWRFELQHFRERLGTNRSDCIARSRHPYSHDLNLRPKLQP